MDQPPRVEMILRLDIIVNSFRFIGKTPEFQLGCIAHCATARSASELDQIEWVVYKSFEECQVFDTRMRSGALSSCMAAIPFVPLYKTKTFFGQSMKPSFLATRQRDLQEYFSRVTGIPGVTHFQTPEGSSALAEFVLVHANVAFDRPPFHAPSSSSLRSSLISHRPSSFSNAVLHSQMTTMTPIDDPPTTTIGTPRTSDESSASSSDDELHLTEAQQAELQALIFQRITDHAGADAVKVFQKRARRFGKAVDGAVPAAGADFYAFMVDTFGIEFCQWLVPSLAALLPDKQKRHALTLAMTPSPAPTVRLLPATHSTWPSWSHVDEDPPAVPPPHRPTTRTRPASDAAIPSSRGTRPPSRSRPQSLNAKQVLAKVRDLVDGDERRVEEFRYMTKELRAHRTSPAQYAQFVVYSFGADASKDVLVSVADAMADNQIQEDLHAAAAAASLGAPTLGASFHQKRDQLARRKSMDRPASFTRRSSSISSFGAFEDEYMVRTTNGPRGYDPQGNSDDHDDDDHDDEAKDVTSDKKILNRLRHQGAVNLMSFKA
ncbi:hypothetical protein DYB26_000405 [Aphanomyces astaci]|uniref:ZNF598/HEL2 PAH domain-containing protein n=1 Tax=Aphanomyces astaci TaxID=112090 RepID=A0A3R7A1N1_APHAT|nr:hypothetical protein DYB26_000405 [Aphanomyces astaci]